jgi:site-specific recombinase XerD
LPPLRRPGRVGPTLARWFDRLLLASAIDRDRALVWLLAHGLRVNEVVALRPDDVDLAGGRVRVRGRHEPTRAVPLSPRGIQRIDPWATERRRGTYPWLFPGPDEDHHAALTLPRQIVRRLAEHVFPGRPAIQQRINAAGFRDVFLTRAIAHRVSPLFLTETLGLERLSHARAYMQTRDMDHAHRELDRLCGRWRRWI